MIGIVLIRRTPLATGPEAGDLMRGHVLLQNLLQETKAVRTDSQVLPVAMWSTLVCIAGLVI